MSERYDILGIGAALVDILVRCSDELLLTHGLEKGRMHLISAERAAALQVEATQLQASGAKLVSGGSAANTVLGVASFAGAKLNSGFLGCIAADALGTIFVDDLVRAGVDFRNIAAAGHSEATGYCICFITPDGERTMATHLGASGTVAARANLETPRLLYVEGYTWDTDARVDLVERAIATTKAAGGQVALTLSDAWCAEAYRAHFLRACRAGQVDILFANEAELLALMETDSFAAALANAQRLAPIIACTRAERGAVILTVGERIEVVPVPVPRVVDATGAGDSFAAGFLYGQLTGLPLAASGQLGARAASLVISQIGARPHIPFSTLLQETSS